MNTCVIVRNSSYVNCIVDNIAKVLLLVSIFTFGFHVFCVLLAFLLLFWYGLCLGAI